MKLLDLINAMLFGTNFPEGFRAGMALRGFNLGTTRQLLSPREQSDLEDIRSKIACILADCGFREAAGACRRPGSSGAGESPREPEAKPRPTQGVEVEGIVREVMRQLRAGSAGE
jgi:4-hydroxy-tetrahydrodipicolinate synthase